MRSLENPKLFTLPQAMAEREALRRAGKRVVLTNGVFDLLHTGHLYSLQRARQCGDALFTSDDLPDPVLADLFGQPDGLLPELKDFTFSCSHCRTPFCLYRAATLLAVATEFDLKPIKLFELRGATRELMITRAAQQTPDNADEWIAGDDLSSLFGIDLV